MRDAEQQLEWDYDDYQEAEIDRYIEGHRTEFEALKEAKSKEDRERFRFTTESMTVISAKNEIRKKMTFLTFEEFLDRRKQGTDFSLKPVAVSPAVEPEVRELQPTASVGPVVESSPSNQALLLLPEPAMPEPMMIELASDPLPPADETDGNGVGNFA
jgi:hypothetical protein